jgi:RNA polymerase sigma-70 factor (ECF subfamily)
MAEPTDEELAARGCLGDLDAFGLLVRRHYPRIVGLCSNLLVERSEADDAAQEIFLKAHRALARFAGEARFSTWLYRIAVNHCTDLRRKAFRRGTVSLDAIVSAKGEPAGGLLSGGASGGYQAEEAALAQTLLSELPDDYREALVLRIEGLSYEEIAAALGCSLDAVKARLRRARRLLAAKMGRSASEAGIKIGAEDGGADEPRGD